MENHTKEKFFWQYSHIQMIFRYMPVEQWPNLWMKATPDTFFVLLMIAWVMHLATNRITKNSQNIMEWKRHTIFCILITGWTVFKYRI